MNLVRAGRRASELKNENKTGFRSTKNQLFFIQTTCQSARSEHRVAHHQCSDPQPFRRSGSRCELIALASSESVPGLLTQSCATYASPTLSPRPRPSVGRMRAAPRVCILCGWCPAPGLRLGAPRRGSQCPSCSSPAVSMIRDPCPLHYYGRTVLVQYSYVPVQVQYRYKYSGTCTASIYRYGHCNNT